MLVTGIAGYIGSVVGELLLENEHEVVGIDDLRHGHAAAVPHAARFLQADIEDAANARDILATEAPDAVVHLAAEALIDESVRDPGRFFRANVVGGLNLLDSMVASGVSRMVFSSTAAVYGEPSAVPITEDAELSPVNAYGESKLAFERMLAWYRSAHALRAITFRYFNACGATELHGEDHRPETHLLASLLEVAAGLRDDVKLFGTDYATPDGTCIRDYVHVRDIAQAHLLALAALETVDEGVFNLGNGNGYSNRDVIESVRRVTGQPVPVVEAPRRPGDPTRLVADAGRACSALGWDPSIAELDAIVGSAWAWRQAHPRGYQP